MLSRWLRYLSQGPAALMWSVVHLPSTLISIQGLLNILPIPQVEWLEELELDY